ncbi:Pycsar system effector family protein [Streptomyces sp. NPDC087294]|uniref:Pycsar system effector family protein n=1 Tax=Streptomyces sp. NPDC087294 TaxID=3365777 RepID=UPI00382841C9
MTTTAPANDLNARLTAADASLTNEMNRVDGKVNALLTSFGLPLAVLIALVPTRPFPPSGKALIGAGAVGLVAAMLVLLLMVVRPRMQGAPRGSWLYWAQCTPEELLADLHTQEHRAVDITRRSVMLRRKFMAVNVAVLISSVALILIVAALFT